MHKRLVLVGITLLVVFLALMAFYLATRHAPTNPQMAQDTPPTLTPMSEEVQGINTGRVELYQAKDLEFFGPRDPKDGHVPYSFGFAKRAPGKAGQFEISQPWVKFFDRNRQVIEITAERANASMDSTEKQAALPKTGALEGNVRIEIYHLPEAVLPHQALTRKTKIEKPPVETVIELERLDFELEYSRMTSNGPVKVWSDQAVMEGANLSMTYDQVNEQLQELELQHIQEIRIASNLAEKISPASPKEKADTDKSKAKKTDAGNKKASPLYQIDLSQHITLVSGTDKLQADQLTIWADLSQPKRSKKTGPSTAPATTSTSPATAETLIKPNTENWTVLTTNGPLRINLVNQTAGTMDKSRLKLAVSGTPMRIWRQDQLAVEADSLTYDITTDQVNLKAAPGHPVRLIQSPEKWVTADKEIALDRQSGLATLQGPGQMSSQEEDKPRLVSYAQQMQIQFDAEESKGEVVTSDFQATPLWVSFTGGVRVEDAAGQYAADSGKLTFYPNKTDNPVLQELLLKGGVNANLSRENRRFTSQELKARFPFQEKQSPTPEYLWAGGQVYYEDPNYIIEAGESIELTFASPTGKSVKTASSSRKVIDTIDLGRFDLDTAVARGPNGQVRLTDKQQSYQVTGDEAVGKTIDHWVITGRPAKITGLNPSTPLEELQGPTIIADRKNGRFEIAGAGTLNAKSPLDFTGRAAQEPLPLHVRWLDSVTYDTRRGTIELRNVSAEITELQQGQRKSVNTLTGPAMIIQLGGKKPSTGVSRDESAPIALGDLSRLTVHGPGVIVKRTDWEPDSTTPSRTVTMRAEGLIYDDPNQLITADGAGDIDIYEQKPSVSQTSNQADGLDKTVTRLFNSNQPGYSLIRYQKGMQFNLAREEVVFDGNVTIDHVPLTPALKKPTPAQLATLEGRMYFRADQIAVGTRRDPNGPTDQLAVSHLKAQGNVLCEVVDKNQTQAFTSESARYNQHTGQLSFLGSDSFPVRFNDMRFLRVDYSLRTRELYAIPVEMTAVY